MTKDIQFGVISEKGWGHELWVVNGPLYCGKILYFNKDKSCSLHSHKLKVETFHVYRGKIQLLIYSDHNQAEEYLEEWGPIGLLNACKKIELNQGDYYHIEQMVAHKIIALEDSEIIEFSTQHFEDDSYRLISGD